MPVRLNYKKILSELEGVPIMSIEDKNVQLNLYI